MGAGWRAAFASVAASLLFSACAINAGRVSPEQAAADLQSRIEQADVARQSGDIPKATGLLHDAAQSDPNSKQPWVKLAQMQFEAGEYSAAIVAAEEALQRDANDSTALSVLSVGGLRIAANALQQLRKGSAVSGSTRVEAEALARTIRESLGEDVLVPAAANSASSSAGQPARPGRSRASTVNRPTSASSASAAPGGAAGNVHPIDRPGTSNAGGRNPFNVLQ